MTRQKQTSGAGKAFIPYPSWIAIAAEVRRVAGPESTAAERSAAKVWRELLAEGDAATVGVSCLDRDRR